MEKVTRNLFDDLASRGIDTTSPTPRRLGGTPDTAGARIRPTPKPGTDEEADAPMDTLRSPKPGKRG
jgi:hypothetical protein